MIYAIHSVFILLRMHGVHLTEEGTYILARFLKRLLIWLTPSFKVQNIAQNVRRMIRWVPQNGKMIVVNKTI